MDTHTSNPAPFTTPGAIQLQIRRLANKKAPGDDKIINAALKFLPKKGILTLTNIINGCLRHSYFPTAWKLATIITIPKPGKDPTDPVNHRPIALLSSISKIYERVILKILNSNIVGKIRPEQHAFRQGHSTTSQIVNLIDNISMSLSANEHTAAVFLDVEKAFDTVWHDGLLHKMLLMNIPIHTIKIIESFLRNRTFKVRVEDKTSSIRIAKAGVPQGSCLSPTLFLIYTNDLPVHDKCNIALFADDTMFSSRDKNVNRARLQLQRQLVLAGDWFNKWKLKINPSKTVAVMFGKTKPYRIPPLTVQNSSITWSHNAKYLGVTLDKRLIFTEHVTQIIKKGTRIRGMLYPVLNRKSPLSLKTRIRLFSMYIIPILTYAGAAWAPFLPKSQWKRLEAIQTIGLRTISGLPTYLKNEILLKQFNIPTLKNNILQQSKAMFYKNKYSSHTHIQNLGCQNPPHTPQKTLPRPLDWATQNPQQ